MLCLFPQECTDHLLDSLDHQLKLVEDESKEYRWDSRQIITMAIYSFPMIKKLSCDLYIFSLLMQSHCLLGFYLRFLYACLPEGLFFGSQKCFLWPSWELSVSFRGHLLPTTFLYSTEGKMASVYCLNIASELQVLYMLTIHPNYRNIFFKICSIGLGSL